MPETNPTEYHQSREHFRHCPGVPEAPEWKTYWNQRLGQRLKNIGNRMPYLARMDAAWLVMLHEQGVLPLEKIRPLFPVLHKARSERGWGGEAWIKQQLGGDEDGASLVNFGRTLQEPTFRMMMREAILFAIDEVLPTLEVLLEVADENLDTIMAGHSHWAHAQPTTYAQYLLAVHDGLARGLEQLELAYRQTNLNSGGCGACSGTGWPTDRERITELLGFDGTVEVAYDCEASQENILTALFAASNLAITLSRAALDFNVWVTEEWNLFTVDMSWRGVSSFMPHKANAGNKFEHIRMAVDDLLAQMQRGIYCFKNEPLQDILPVYRSEACLLEGLGHLEQALGTFRNGLRYTTPNKDRMWKLLTDGYSGSPDLVRHMIKHHDYAGREAHRICATMVRLARERNIAPRDCTGALLDEAAEVSGDRKPGLTDEVVQKWMGLEHFLATHNNPGDPNPEQTGKLVELRRGRLAELTTRQDARKAKLEEADRKLQAAIDKLTSD
ncbi:MAG: lyase family protein, partial [Planctomycetota bacterium]